jgi:hypothetical protein
MHTTTTIQSRWMFGGCALYITKGITRLWRGVQPDGQEINIPLRPMGIDAR